jgi:hypothetical protein
MGVIEPGRSGKGKASKVVDGEARIVAHAFPLGGELFEVMRDASS